MNANLVGTDTQGAVPMKDIFQRRMKYLRELCNVFGIADGILNLDSNKDGIDHDKHYAEYSQYAE